MIPEPLTLLIRQLAKLPGLGPRSAQRLALHLLSSKQAMGDLQSILTHVAGQVQTCSVCGNIGLTDPCHICTDTAREQRLLCVVEGVDDLWALERGGAFRGQYHVLGGVVSVVNGVSPNDIRLQPLVERVMEKNAAGGFDEVILALGASIDGQTTAHLVAQRLAPSGVTLTTLARGMPVGAEVDYLDDGTLSIALNGRRRFAE